MPPQHTTASEALKTSLPQGHAGTVTCSYKAQRRERSTWCHFHFCSRSHPCNIISGPGLAPRAGFGLDKDLVLNSLRCCRSDGP